MTCSDIIDVIVIRRRVKGIVCVNKNRAINVKI